MQYRSSSVPQMDLEVAAVPRNPGPLTLFRGPRGRRGRSRAGDTPDPQSAASSPNRTSSARSSEPWRGCISSHGSAFGFVWGGTEKSCRFPSAPFVLERGADTDSLRRRWGHGERASADEPRMGSDRPGPVTSSPDFKGEIKWPANVTRPARCSSWSGSHRPRRLGVARLRGHRHGRRPEEE